MGQNVSSSDFSWSQMQEPHKSRNKMILEKHPEIKSLMGSHPKIKWAVLFMVIIQILAAWCLRAAPWTTIFFIAYVFGGVVNHAMELAVHELAHNLAFGNSKPIKNRLLGIFGNIIIGIPMSVTFKKYHMEHHRYLGDEAMDVDLPTKLEGKLFHNTFTKLIWVILQPFFYSIRPLFMRPKPMDRMEKLNTAVQICFDILILYTMGYKSLLYLIACTLLAMGFHPVAGHFISEHYMFNKEQETYSYYGPLNYLTFNVGYHNEHHDFPNIPGWRLPQVKAMAPEFYDNLPHHTSWVKVIYDFITDPSIGPYARMKRNPIPVKPSTE